MAIPFLSFKRATTVPKKLIDSQHYKQLTRKTLTAFHVLLHAVKSIVLKNLNYSKTIQRLTLSFRNPLLFHSNVKKNTGNFLVKSSFQTNDQSGTFKCARSQCKTCSFIHNEEELGTQEIHWSTDHFTCTSTLISLICGVSLHLGSSESHKTLEQKFIFQIGILDPHGINERFSHNYIQVILSPYPHQWRSSTFCI